ncbi:tyrosine-protein phosphatase non-receptor type substrate 1-like isoform X3 [Aquila chrysaetos chrysaetos]|uniref:tyrosine-protein phosphatase non-receptor type substrate 1-like isoform X3 n=2 Tax=Aquila chrysaetos chrysaetos TaxID=223781 RepID=UPI001176544A|nr:tyrosine-protein phosphatase non-receptor type substrate 1-like isoform X3 [Aquila chrysaetos chrysaetos]
MLGSGIYCSSAGCHVPLSHPLGAQVRKKEPTMEPLPCGPGRAAWPLTCLVLLSLYGWPGAGAQVGLDFELQQPQDKVSVTAGETLNLTCTMSGVGPTGTVKWLKGWGSGNETVYDQAVSFARVTRVVSESNTDFSIRIRDVRPEDAGTYYCVKFDKRVGSLDVFRRGKGTVVSVHAKPTPPVVSGPENRTGLGQRVPFTCTAGGFFPKEIDVKWFKGKDRISVQPPSITLGRTNSSYDMSSTAAVTLQEDDVRSQLVCEVRHSTLTTPLRGTYRLSKALRVSPSVSVVADVPSPVEVNKTVNFTCHVKRFYPGDVAVAWLENGMEIKVENISQPVETPRGLFELRSVVEVQATEEKNGSVFTCRVVHDAQDPVSGTATLWIAAPARGGSSDRTQADNDNLLLIYIVVGVVCTVLALLVAAILYLIRAKQSKAGKSSPSARLHEPEKSSEATTQESDPNNLTYADLNFDRERKTIRRMVEMSQQSEYACIQTNRGPTGDDNLTYADLDMVHLSKAPRRPAPQPEEAGSEYASVQIPRK